MDPEPGGEPGRAAFWSWLTAWGLGLGALAMAVTPKDESSESPSPSSPAGNLEAVGMLTAGVAHDFNNILTAVMGYIQLATDRLESGEAEEAQAYLEQAESGCLHAAGTVRQLLCFARPGLPETEIDLAQAVRGSLDLVRGALPRGVTLEVELPPDPAPVRASRVQIDEIVVNLCSNAWQAMPAGRGTITVAVERVFGAARDAVALRIADDGEGVPEEIADRIFEPFFTTKPAGLGTGLGLSVIRHIVSLIGGDIRLETPAGGGAAFRVELPLCAPTDV